MKSTFYKKYSVAIWVVVAIIALKGYTYLRNVGKLGTDLVKNIKNDTTVAVINQATTNGSIGPVRAQICLNVANTIYDAFYKYGFGLMEDEEAARDSFMTLNTIEEAVLCASIYRSSFKHGLSTDMEKWILFGQWDGVKTFMRNAIKNVA